MQYLNEYTFILIAGWILPSALLGFIGEKRLIGFWKSILISLFLSPLIGAIAVLASKTKQTDLIEKELLKFLKNEKAESLSEELGRLQNLRINGTLSDEEFEEAKNKLFK